MTTDWTALTCARLNTLPEHTPMFLNMNPATVNTCDITTGCNRTPMVAVGFPPDDRMLPPTLQVRSADDPQLIVFDGPRECQICALNGLGNTYRTVRARKFGTYCPLLMPLRYECLYCGSSTWLRLENYVAADKATSTWLVNAHLFARFYDKNGDQRHVQLAQTYARYNFAAVPPEFEGCRVGIQVPPSRDVVHLGANACVLDSIDTLIVQLTTHARMDADVLDKAASSMCVFYIATEPIHVDETTRIAHRQGRMDVPFVAHDALSTPVSETVGHLAAIKYTRELLVLGAIAELCGAAHVPRVLTVDARDRYLEVLDALMRTPTCTSADCRSMPTHGVRSNLRGECAFSEACAQHRGPGGTAERAAKVARREAVVATELRGPTPARFDAFRSLVAMTSPAEEEEVPDVHAIYTAYVGVLCYKQKGGRQGGGGATAIPKASTRNKCISSFIDAGQRHCIRTPTAAEREAREARDRRLDISTNNGGIRHFPGDVIDVGQKSELVYVPDPTNIMSYVSVTDEFATPVRVDKSAFYNAHNARLAAGTLDAHADVYAHARAHAFTTRLMLQTPFMWDMKATRGKLDSTS
jgi:hypothetical protein